MFVLSLKRKKKIQISSNYLSCVAGLIMPCVVDLTIKIRIYLE